MKCQYCNTELKQGAKFCPNCGKGVVDFDVCKRCGQQIKVGASFCPHCGTNQNEVTTPIQEINKSEVIDTDVVETKKQDEIPVTEAYDEVEEVFLFDEEEENSKKWLWIVGVLLIGVIGGGFYLWKTNKGGSLSLAEVDADSVMVADTVVTDLTSVEAIKARLTDIFSQGLVMSDKDAISSFFSKEYRELCAKVEQCDKAHPDDIGFWNGNIWDGGQDGNPKEANIVSIHHSDDATTAYADVKLIHREGEYHSENFMSVYLVLEDENWFIDDINGYKQSMKEYISSADGRIDLVGKVYKGAGNGGGLYTEMTISFFSDNKCRCVSDWYQAYSTPKAVNYTYEVKDEKVIVRYKLDYDGEFTFNVVKDGRVLEFDNSDPEVGGTMANNFMSLEYYGEVK